MRGGWRAIVVALAGILLLVPLPPSTVDRWYSRGLYPVLQRVLTAMSNLTPFAWFDVLILGVTAWFLWRLGQDISGGGRSTGRIGWRLIAWGALVRLVTAAAVLYLMFLTVWGLNYRRRPLTDTLQYDPSAVSYEPARALALEAVGQINSLYESAHGQDAAQIEQQLATGFDETLRRLGLGLPMTPARPKRSLLDPYFRAAGVDGMTAPFFLETLVVSTLLPFERPFILAHEWSHLAGFADESEASFVGWLACLHAPGAAGYSAWLYLYSEVTAVLRRDDRIQVSSQLAQGPRNDLRAIDDRLRGSVKPVVSTAGWRVYDRYLKANRVEAGTASYGYVMRLVLGARFGPDWTPLLRQ